MNSYVTIDGWRANIRFSSAHIIPDYKKCGRLHGHTYAVHAKIKGKLDKKGIILDFSLLKETLKEIVSELDHKILIPNESKILKIEKEKEKVTLFILEKHYIFPVDDCVFLPLSSTSAENLAGYILEKLYNKVSLIKNIDSIEIGVDEGYGQGARILKNVE